MLTQEEVDDAHLQAMFIEWDWEEYVENASYFYLCIESAIHNKRKNVLDYIIGKKTPARQLAYSYCLHKKRDDLAEFIRTYTP